MTTRIFIDADVGPAPPARIQVLPRPGSFAHKQYGAITLTAADIQEFVRNFNAGTYQSRVPIDAEHETKLSGAAGWITRLYAIDDGRGGAEADVEWTDRGRAMLADKRFNFFSPEWFDTWQDPASGRKYSNILVGGALTTRPFFKEGSMRPLAASESEVQMHSLRGVPDVIAGRVQHYRKQGMTHLEAFEKAMGEPDCQQAYAQAAHGRRFADPVDDRRMPVAEDDPLTARKQAEAECDRRIKEAIDGHAGWSYMRAAQWLADRDPQFKKLYEKSMGRAV